MDGDRTIHLSPISSDTFELSPEDIDAALKLSDILDLNEQTCCGLIIDALVPCSSPFSMHAGDVVSKATYLYFDACKVLSKCYGMLVDEFNNEERTALSALARTVFSSYTSDPLQDVVGCIKSCDQAKDMTVIDMCISREMSQVSKNLVFLLSFAVSNLDLKEITILLLYSFSFAITTLYP